MILTGKAKEDFENWYITNKCKTEKSTGATDNQLIKWLYNDDSDVILNAFIIEWFDSVGIIINILNQDLQNWFYYEIKTLEVIKGFNLVRTRQEATTVAIIKANEIYNNLNT